MMGLFGRQRRSAADVTQALRDALRDGRVALKSLEENVRNRSSDDISRALHAVKEMLFAEANGASNSGTVSPPTSTSSANNVTELVSIACKTDFLLVLAGSLELMEFEARKDAVQVFNNLLRRGLSDSRATGAENASQPSRIALDAKQMMEVLIDGYDNADIALNCGAMLRECVRSEVMARMLLDSAKFWRFFDLVELSDFDVASDAFASFKEILTRHVVVAASFMERNLDQFVTSYNNLLRSENYVTRRQSLKLLSEMLVVRANFKIMTTYIASATNLRLVMNLLLDNRKTIRFEAFHVFKVFVANPKKTADVRQILLKNKERLLSYLSDFLSDRPDEQFHVDRNLILDEIRALTATAESTPV